MCNRAVVAVIQNGKYGVYDRAINYRTVSSWRNNKKKTIPYVMCISTALLAAHQELDAYMVEYRVCKRTTDGHRSRATIKRMVFEFSDSKIC